MYRIVFLTQDLVVIGTDEPYSSIETAQLTIDKMVTANPAPCMADFEGSCVWYKSAPTYCTIQELGE